MLGQQDFLDTNMFVPATQKSCVGGITQGGLHCGGI